MKSKGILLATAASLLASAMTIGPAFGQAANGPAGVPPDQANGVTSGDVENRIKSFQDQLENLRNVQDQLHSLQQQLDALKASEAAARDEAAKDAAAREAAAKAAAVKEVAAQAAAEKVAKQKPADAASTILTEYVPEYIRNVQLVVPAVSDKKIHLKGITITFGGFLAAETVWRSRNLESDIGSPGFAKIPFPGPGGSGSGNGTGSNVAVGDTSEFRFTARQSRVQGLVEGDFDPDTHFAMYGEFDFLGGAASANSNESNSFQPRIRNLYGTVDWTNWGLHMLFGQSWSLATLNGTGIAERTELAPPTIEAQYTAGFVWTRQPQIRLVENFGNEFWLAVSAENAQTTIGGTAPSGYTGLTVSSGSGLNGSSTNVGLAEFNPGITLTLNHVPDVIGKAAWQPAFFGGNVHLEAIGLYRDFYDRFGTALSNVRNHNDQGGGVGVAGLIKVFPGMLDLQFDTLFGQGIGRYTSSQLPDVTYNADGTFKPLQQVSAMAGLTWHATKALDIYAWGGMDQQKAGYFSGTINTTAQNIGYGNPNFTNTGCFSFSSAASCTGNVGTVQQINFGAWDNMYDGDFGRFRVGLQYSYTDLKAFTGVGGAPHTNDQMVFTSIRYYPFQ